VIAQPIYIMDNTDLTFDSADTSRPIIMVDDAPLEYELVERAFSRSILQNPLMHFPKGEEFLTYLRTAYENNQVLPALILMDINMPEMTGFEVLKSMRGDSRFKKIPTVLMMSSSTDPQDVERSVEAGADGYFVKRYKPSEYTEFFNSLM